MRRRDFVRGLLALGVGAAVADRLAFVEGLGRSFPSAETDVFRPSGFVDLSALNRATIHGIGSISDGPEWTVDYSDTRASRFSFVEVNHWPLREFRLMVRA